MSSFRKLSSALMIVGLFATGCSDDKKSASDEETSSSVADDATTESSDASTPGADTSDASTDEPGTIIDVATEAGSFATLLQAAEAAGLTETLTGEGPFTIFAPTDEAFAALPAGTLDSLLADKEALKNVLLYHVVQGDEIEAADVVELTSADMANGDTIAIKVVDGKVVLNDDVNVVTTDIAASNGVIHVIDKVLVPAAK
ncbi:MAG: fasciclin domain-containing protein [Acidimicrobiia bacterium]